MIYIMKNGGHDTYNIKQFTLDTPDDLPNLPTSGIAVGSAALVISTSDVYMLNSKGEWDLIASDTEGILPSYSAEDIGKILEVGEGGILAWAANNALPSVTSEDEGKVLKVDDQGEWVAATDSNTQYTAGANISIDENNEISAIDTKYTAGSGIEISEQNVISNTAEGNTDIIAEEYDRYKSYNIGDYCIYNNKLYKCSTQIESTEWYTQLNFQQGSVRTTYEFINGSGKFGFYKSGNYYYVIACTTDNNAVVERTNYQSGFEPNVSQFALTDAYTGIIESGFYNRNSIGSYTSPHDDYFNSQNDALYDFFSRPYFDSSKWTEVTVGDELKSIKGDIPTYTAGTNIQISAENVISATDTTYSAGNGITISKQNEISADSQLPSVTSADEGKVLAVNDQGAWAAQEQETITTKSLSGDLVSFTDGADAPLVDCKVHIEAVQSGSGDPSPTNVRPITGWTGANIYVNNKNFVNIADSTISSAGYVLNNVAINVPKGGFVLSFDFSGTVGSSASIRFDDENGNAIFTTSKTVTSGKNAVNVTLDTKASYIKIYSQSIGTYSNFQIEKGAQATDYVAQSQTINNIDWQSTAGTVYGGTLDVKTGVLTVTHVIDDRPQDLTWSEYQYINGVFTVNIDNKKNGKLNIISNKLKNYDGTVTNMPDLNVTGATNNSRIYVRFDTYAGDLSGFKTEIANGYVFVYELATPVTYQLTPTEIRSLLGVNNVWADCGAITELKYFVQGTQPIIDYIDNSKELPSVSSSDEGKVLTVDSTGHWVASAIPDGTDTNY